MPGPADERTVHPRGRDPYLAREQSIIGKVSTRKPRGDCTATVRT